MEEFIEIFTIMCVSYCILAIEIRILIFIIWLFKKHLLKKIKQ
jgi:hypothetical protein